MEMMAARFRLLVAVLMVMTGISTVFPVSALAASLWSASTVPGVVDSGPDSPVELGVRFRSDSAGTVSGIRFYKSSANTGSHVASLWSNGGTLLASATFSNESGSGWQEVQFPTPVAINANTVYVASYHTNGGHYSYDLNYFKNRSIDTPPLHAPADGTSGYNGVYLYGSGGFPNQNGFATNYWVDVVFTANSGSDTTPPTVTAFTLPATSTSLSVPVSSLTATDNTGVTGYLLTESSTTPAAGDPGWSATPPTGYIFTSAGSKTLYAWARDGAGNVSASRSASVVITLTAPSGSTLWPATAVPAVVDGGPDSPVELGVRFRSDSAGTVSGIRFYKSSANTGSHVASLWSNGGTLLASATFNNESGSGWQEVQFPAPVAINANTVYVASYHTNGGHYSYDLNYFKNRSIDTPPLHAPADGTSGYNGVYLYGSGGFPNQNGFATNYWVDVVFTASSGSDTTPPTVTAFTLPATSTSLSVPVSSLTATDNTGVTGYLLTESSTTPAAGDAGWSATPPTGYTFTSAGSKTLYAWARDGAGNVSASRSASVVITLTAPSGSTLWPATAVPAVVDGGPDSPVELGVRFRSDSAGTVSGIRFYKSSANTGSHVASLWSNGGTLLASATFNNESGSGWQEVQFPAPVAINANTVYVASYHTNGGHYSYDLNYFKNRSIDTPPLHAPADGTSGYNGVYLYGSGGFPNQDGFATNYWVDVVFTASSGSDTTPPAVTAFTLGTSSGLSVPVSSLTATDNVGVTGYLVTESSTTPAAGDAGWSATPPTGYTFTSSGSKTLYAWARDGAGNVSASKSATVSIGLPVAANGPILVVYSSANPFSVYYAEILTNEGLTEFDQADIAGLTPAILAAHDVVLLGEMQLSTSQVSMLSDWVTAGGQLIAMRPDKKLAGLLGLTDLGSTRSNAYMLINTVSGPGVGLPAETLQYHGAADLYTLNGAASIAAIYNTATSASSSPAVTLASVGTNGGQAAAFAYDLARSVIYTRQGNTAWSGQERDGNTIIRSDDLYFGAASFDPQTDWVDLGKVAIPQADEQQRLLANLVIQMNMHTRPLPRFWYFPRNLPAAVVMTGDDHGIGGGGTAGRFDAYNALSTPGCSVNNWECIRGSSYLYAANTLTNAQANAYNNAGFEIGLHVNTNCANWTPATLPGFYSSQLAGLAQKYPSLPSPTTNRTHCIAWSDYISQPGVELQFGIRLDTSYYYWPASWIGNNPGFFTGSGMPMRFAKPDGTIIDVYQAPSQMTDESGQPYPETVDTLLDRAVGPEGYFGAFVVNAHTDLVTSSVSDAVINSARERGIPVISARQLLTWLDGRNDSTFSSIGWNGTTLSFSLQPAPGSTGLTVLVPVAQGRAVTSIRNNGATVPFQTVAIKGIAYARFAAAPGTWQITYGQDTSAPTVSTVNPANGASNVDPQTDIKVTFNEPLNAGTLNSSTVRLVNAAGTTVPTTISYNPVTLTLSLVPNAALAEGTGHTVSISGPVRDLAGNALPSFSSSFTTSAPSTGPVTLWASTTVPGIPDGGADSAVELGVKFRSDSSGQISGIRFYKHSANTGTHVANLWSSTGQLLASATFNSETASGWQQVNFTNPVSILANTVYVASYHAKVGHYSYNPGYFTGKGVDSGPLHALADGVSGYNGVYAYGTNSKFPDQNAYGTNYWVDVVFTNVAQPGLMQVRQIQPVTLSSITLAPAGQRISLDATLQFTATGIYSDGSKRDLTKQVTWSSSDANVATISATGLVTPHTIGTVTVSATVDGITASTDLTTTQGMAKLMRQAPVPGDRLDHTLAGYFGREEELFRFKA